MKNQNNTSVVASNDNTATRTLAKLVNSVQRRIRISRTTRLLEELDDGILEDIGINRYDIPAEAARIIDNDNRSVA